MNILLLSSLFEEQLLRHSIRHQQKSSVFQVRLMQKSRYAATIPEDHGGIH